MANVPTFDQTVFAAVNSSEQKIENKLGCDLMYFYGEIRAAQITEFRNFVEKLANRRARKVALGICLTTPGGEAEVVEKMVHIIRHHYPDKVYFIVPSAAFSAGTIFCMSGDKIFMDYSSSLGPIDPQVPDKEDKYLVPALGYLDKVNELIEKSKNKTISPGELAILVKQDLAMLRFYEQARDLSIALIKEWLVERKFKDWTVHRTTNPGTPVTPQQKEQRAAEVAGLLSDNKTWHSHGRMINMEKLKSLCKLEIDDYGTDKELNRNIRIYSDTLTDYFNRHSIRFFLHNRRVTGV